MIFGKSRLTTTLERWSLEGGSLFGMLSDIGECPIKSRAEALAVSMALAVLRCHPERALVNEFFTPLHVLTKLVLHAATGQALRRLIEAALPQLRQWVQDLFNGVDVKVEDVALIIYVLAQYRQSEDIDRIAAFAQSHHSSKCHYWSLIFEQFYDDPVRAELLFKAMDGALPQGFAGVAYLDLANMRALASKMARHPFDTLDGHRCLEEWLRDPDPENFSYAHSATAALNFVDQGIRQHLLLIAREHPDITVRLEAAWGNIKHGDRTDLKLLEESCLNPCFSTQAQAYLKDLGYELRIPGQTQELEFQALEKMCNWLKHPNEFGKPPTTLELFDSRVLFWPPTNDRRRLWLVKYRYDNINDRNIEGIGLVGSIFSPIDVPEGLSPEDVYSLYCCWELERLGDKRATKEHCVAAGRELLRKTNQGIL